MSSLQSVIAEWEELETEFKELEENHKNYVSKVDEVKNLQAKCVNGIAHQRYRMKQVADNLKKYGKSNDQEIASLYQTIEERKTQFREFEDVLPHKNGIYLSIVLGQVNVSLLSKKDKYLYKQDYEKFKLIVSTISMVLAFCLLFFISSRYLDAAYHFLLVWYYCTLTIRESILIVNGSRIKGWWVAHHFVSTVCTGVLLIWPDGVTYRLFRQQFMIFSVYLSFVQVLQFYYQSGCLYRLRALGERHNMDITVEGFQSWMWKGLSFILPFLFGGYIFQFYNAYTLYHLAFHPQSELQVPVVCFMFFVLASGNAWTTLLVIREKLKSRLQESKPKLFRMKSKYKFNWNNNKETTKVL
ncbi:transmembrane protein 120A [Lingula anatina]|uniref:Transmembrane protein 120A n=1 Tax=Lingula anatina TaxID=7574 RepID=A0A1S3JTB2_LINAN|nr:transmembrane protein 120A [Lingula anatina]|eukprot:XP_013413304.1 transmembrane protein 120A [Lingula anatina]